MIFIANVGFQYSIEADNEKEAERIVLERYEESIKHSYEQLKKGIHSTPIHMDLEPKYQRIPREA